MKEVFKPRVYDSSDTVETVDRPVMGRLDYRVEHSVKFSLMERGVVHELHERHYHIRTGTVASSIRDHPYLWPRNWELV